MSSASDVASKPHIQLEALHVLAHALAVGEFRARAVLERACAAVAGGFGFERVGIVRYLPETSTLIPFAAHGLTSAELATLPPALPIANFSAFQDALASGKAVFVEEPTGEEAVPEEIARGFGIGSFVIVPLVSDARCLGFLTCDERGEAFSLDAAEVALLTTFGTLIAAFLERAIEQGELRRLNELKSQFAALASHELRTPVAAIYGAVRTLDEREQDLSPKQQVELRRMLSQQSKRLFELVENLLDLSRLEADSLRISPTEIDVRARLAEIVDAVFDGGREVRIEVPETSGPSSTRRRSIASSRTCSRTPCGTARRRSSSLPPERTASSRSLSKIGVAASPRNSSAASSSGSHAVRHLRARAPAWASRSRSRTPARTEAR